MLLRSSTKAFEANPDQEFDHYLAVKLGMTVEELRRRVSMPEWVAWQVYFQRIAQRRELESRRR